MNASLAWDNPEQTIIRLTLSDGWTWTELYELNRQTTAMLRAADHTVHILIDYTQTRDLPFGGIMHARNIMRDYPANFGLLLVVTHNTLVRRMAGMFQTLYPGKNVHTISSFDDAYRLAAEYQVSAPAPTLF